MKQITKQYEKQFRKLAPEWDEELKIPLNRGQKPRNPKLDIVSYKCCIMGEIHGFSESYIYKCKDGYCSDCNHLGVKLFYESILKHDSPIIIELMSHINEHHPELMKDLY